MDDNYLTSIPHIYAVGALSQLQPIGIYTIPEISYVGGTEDERTQSSIPFEVGVSRYRELTRGAILGTRTEC